MDESIIKKIKKDVYGIDQYYEENSAVYHNDQESFYKELLKHYFSNHELAYGQYFLKIGFSRRLKNGRRL